MKYGGKVNLSPKSCSDISELEYNLRNCSELGKKLLETKKVARNTRSCQKVAEQRVESTRFGRGNRGRKAGVRYDRQRKGADGGRWQFFHGRREFWSSCLPPRMCNLYSVFVTKHQMGED